MKFSRCPWTKSRKGRNRAFSLVEIVFAIGVAAVVLAAILALLPVALDSAAASQTETRAMWVAHSVFAGLEADAGTKSFLVKGAEIESSTVSWLDLSRPGVNFLSFDENGRAEDDAVTENEYLAGRSGSEFLARISVSTNGLPPGLSTVEVAVTAPGVAPYSKRRRYTLVSQLLQN